MYGQCSEICGVHHSFMPIVLKINHGFTEWFDNKYILCDYIFNRSV
jgi:heme/copper-type cytochrome/quinol oxidase subunit 2